MAYKNKATTKQKFKQKQKPRAIGKTFEIDYIAEEYQEELEEDEFENTPIDIFDEDALNYVDESDHKWTSLPSDIVAVKKSKACVFLLETEEGVRAVPIKWMPQSSKNMEIFSEIIDKINERKFKSFDDMIGKFKSDDFKSPDLFRKMVTNNYAILQPYGKIVKLNFITSSGRQKEDINKDALKNIILSIFEDGYIKKYEVVNILINDYGYSKSIQRRKEFKDAYEEAKNLWKNS